MSHTEHTITDAHTNEMPRCVIGKWNGFIDAAHRRYLFPFWHKPEQALKELGGCVEKGEIGWWLIVPFPR